MLFFFFGGGGGGGGGGWLEHSGRGFLVGGSGGEVQADVNHELKEH